MIVVGLLTIYGEMTGKKWVSRWCSVKYGSLEVQGDPLEDGSIGPGYASINLYSMSYLN